MNAYCTGCGKPLASEAKFCAECGRTAGGGGAGQAARSGPDRAPAVNPQLTMLPGGTTDEMILMRDMSQGQQMFFHAEMKNIRKDPDTAFWLAFCLGGAGGQHFYLGNTGRGVLYLCFFWTAIPVIVSLIELFSIKEKVRQLNNQNAMQAAQRAKALMAA